MEEKKINIVTVRWNDGYKEDFQATEVRFGSDLLWMRLEDGDNEIRLLTLPYQYTVHKYKKEGEKALETKFTAPKFTGLAHYAKLVINQKLAGYLV